MVPFQVEERNLSDITISSRARKDYGELKELKESILISGQLNPILIDEHNELIAGERRLKALKELGHTKGYVRVMPGLSRDDKLIIERMENVARKDFLWHEELAIRYELHNLWKAKAEKNKKSWGYRETAKKLNCSLGGLSSDLALAEALETFPELKKQDTKGRARDAYKELGRQALAIQRMNNLSDEEKERLKKLQSGISISKPSKTIPKAKHSDDLPDLNSLTDEEPKSIVDTAIEKLNVSYIVKNYKDFIKELPNNIVGMVELDPPYAIKFDSTYGKTNKIKSKATDWTEKDLYEFYFDYLPIIYDKMLPSGWILCWTGKEHATRTNEIAKEAGFIIQSPGVWTKDGGSSNQPKKNLISNYEMYLLFRKGDTEFKTNSLPAAIHIPTVPAAQRIHQWEKPIELYDHFIKALGRPNTVFLSLFAGSGNALISAAKANMIPMGCDQSQKYVAQFYQKLENYLGLKI